MKKLLAALFAACISLSLNAQVIRTNYRSNNITHISTEYESIRIGTDDAICRVEAVGFPDGSVMYLLYLNLLQKSAFCAPKSVKMGVTLNSGKVLRLEQIGEDSPTKARLESGLFLNRLKYAVEASDMEKMVQGIKSLDIITGWNPDDYIQADFSSDELAQLLNRHCKSILEASEYTIELQASLGNYTENQNSVLSMSNPVVARGSSMAYNVILSHLYYKNTNEEDLDLAFVIGTNGKYRIPLDSPVRFTLADGSAIELSQAREDDNFVYLYPSIEELRRMASAGITAISITYDGGIMEDTFPSAENGFSAAISQQLQLLLSVSPR